MIIMANVLVEFLFWEYRKLVQSHVYEWKLAVSDTDKKEFLKILDVFGKTTTKSSKRHVQAITVRNVSSNYNIKFGPTKSILLLLLLRLKWNKGLASAV